MIPAVLILLSHGVANRRTLSASEFDGLMDVYSCLLTTIMECFIASVVLIEWAFLLYAYIGIYCGWVTRS